MYSQDKDLYAEIRDIQGDFNFNNFYFTNNKLDNIFEDKIKNKENSKKYIFFKFPKTAIFIFILTLLILNFIIKNIFKDKTDQEKNNEKIIIQTDEINIEKKEKENIEIKKNELISSPRPKNITK